MGKSAEIRMLSRVLLLNGTAIPGGARLLVLSNSEHADNQERTIKARDGWECGEDHCRNCLSGTTSSSTYSRREEEEQENQQDECYSLFDLGSPNGVIPAIPHRGEPLTGVTLELYGDDELPIYTLTPLEKPKRGRGRPKSPLTQEQRKLLREQKIVEWDRWMDAELWSWEKLAVLKRGDLQTLASHVGIKNPVSVGTNEDLRSAIAEMLGIE